MRVDLKDASGGLLLIAAAAFFGLVGGTNLPLGTSFRMGPGYFPLLLSGLLALLGLAIIGNAIGKGSAGKGSADKSLADKSSADEGSAPLGGISWRGVALTSAALLCFGLLLPRLGLVPALLAAIPLSAFSSRRMTAGLALALATGLTLFCALLFRYGLGLSAPLFGAS